MPIDFYWFFNLVELTLPFIVFSLYFILFNVFLLLSSEENKREFQNFSYLKITSIINIIFGSIIFIFPNISLSTPYTQNEMKLYVGYNIFRSLFFIIPRIFTMGLIFILIGVRHKEQLGRFLMYAGIFWASYFIWGSIWLSSPEYFYPLLLYLLDIMDILDFSISIYNLLNIGNIANTLAFVFFMIHSYSHNDKNMKIAGFIYIFGPFLLGLSMIPYYLSRGL